MADREDICELVVRFADAVNRLDLEQFQNVWTPEAKWIIDPPTDYISEGPRAEIASAWLDAMKARWTTFVQLVHGTVVDLDGDTAMARSYVTELGIPQEGDGGYYNHGTYVDTLERTPEGWLFRQRHYRYLYVDSAAIAGKGAPVGGVL
jgi:ketosteroid isomerase-like protein